MCVCEFTHTYVHTLISMFQTAVCKDKQTRKNLSISVCFKRNRLPNPKYCGKKKHDFQTTKLINFAWIPGKLCTCTYIRI